MPLNFTPANELPPLYPETLEAGKLSDDNDEVSKTNTWYGQFIQGCNNPVNDEKFHVLMLDFLITEGFHDVAISFAKEAGIEFKPEEIRNTCYLPERDAIRNAVLKGQLETAVELINKLCPNLLEKNKLLNFQILRQQLVELIRKKEVIKALQFAQEHLVDKCDQNKEELEKLEQTYALLAFDRPEDSPFGKLMHSSQRLILSSAINEAIFNEMGAPSSSRLHQLMSIMCWNRYQTLLRGDVNNPTNKQMIAQISKQLFAEREIDDDQLMEEAL